MDKYLIKKERDDNTTTNRSALSPSGLLCYFDKEKLLKLAKLYPDDFNHKNMVTLEPELDLYIDNILHNTMFSSFGQNR